MGKRESPKTKVRSSVGDGAEDEFNGLDHLVHADLDEVELVVTTFLVGVDLAHHFHELVLAFVQLNDDVFVVNWVCSINLFYVPLFVGDLQLNVSRMTVRI